MRYEIVIIEEARKHLKAIGRRDSEDAARIIAKIKLCLGEHLFDRIK